MKSCKNGHRNPERNASGACKKCVAKYKVQYRKEYKSRSKVKGRIRRKRHRTQAIESLGGKCLDCGVKDHRVLVFDHVRGEKSANVSQLLGKAWSRIEAELEKCELTCANCHLIRTNERIPKAVDTFVGRLEKKTHCNHGHPWIKDNIYTDKRNINSCLTCRRDRGREYARKKRRERKADEI